MRSSSSRVHLQGAARASPLQQMARPLGRPIVSGAASSCAAARSPISALVKSDALLGQGPVSVAVGTIDGLAPALKGVADAWLHHVCVCAKKRREGRGSMRGTRQAAGWQGGGCRPAGGCAHRPGKLTCGRGQIGRGGSQQRGQRISHVQPSAGDDLDDRSAPI